MKTELGQEVEIFRLESLKATYERKAQEMDARIAKARNLLGKIKQSEVPSVWAHHVKTAVSFHKGLGGGYAEWDVDAEYKGEAFGFATVSRPTYSHAKKTERKINTETYEVTEWETYSGGSVKVKADFLEQCLRRARENAAKKEEDARERLDILAHTPCPTLVRVVDPIEVAEVRAALVGSDEDFKKKVE